MRSIKYKLFTVCLIQDGDSILLLNRVKKDFPGYIGPGGKVDFPESPLDAAIREVKEETGLAVDNLIFKGIVDVVNEQTGDRSLIFNYLTRNFSGVLLKNSPEGELEWVNIAEIDHLPMQETFRNRIPLFFQEGTFEMHIRWENGRRVPLVRST